MRKMNASDLRVGMVLTFRNGMIDAARYGTTATVTGRQIVESRPFGTRKLLIDLKTETGIDLQWTIPHMRNFFTGM
jgi:hypothetical protein